MQRRRSGGPASSTRILLGPERAAALACLGAQPILHRHMAAIDLGIEPDWPGHNKDNVADDVGIAVCAAAGQHEADRQEPEPDDEIEEDDRPHGTLRLVAAVMPRRRYADRGAAAAR